MSANPLYEVIYTHLRERIDSGELAVGDRLPTERELSKQFNVSRITAQKALEKLNSEGAISRHPGRGSFVIRSTAAQQDAPGSAARVASAGTLIGLVLPELGESYGLTLLSGIERSADDSNLLLAICRSYGRQDAEVRAVRRLLDLGVNGLIVFPVNGEHYNPEILRLHVEGFPLVLVDKYLPGVPVCSVSTDNKSAAEHLTRHLIELGHRHIGFCSPSPADTVTLEDRWDGFTAALESSRIPFRPEWALTNLPTETPAADNAGYRPEHNDMLTHYLQEQRELTAVVATEFQAAAHLLLAARRLGLRVPEDLSIACFDSPSSRFLGWQFTHIRQDEETMGSKAVEILREQMRMHSDASAHVATVSLQAKLVSGDSTAAPRQAAESAKHAKIAEG